MQRAYNWVASFTWYNNKVTSREGGFFAVLKERIHSEVEQSQIYSKQNLIQLYTLLFISEEVLILYGRNWPQGRILHKTQNAHTSTQNYMSFHLMCMWSCKEHRLIPSSDTCQPSWCPHGQGDSVQSHCCRGKNPQYKFLGGWFTRGREICCPSLVSTEVKRNPQTAIYYFSSFFIYRLSQVWGLYRI